MLLGHISISGLLDVVTSDQLMVFANFLEFDKEHNFEIVVYEIVFVEYKIVLLKHDIVFEVLDSFVLVHNSS